MKKIEANLGPQKKSKNQKFSKSKSVLPKLSASFFFMPEKSVPAPFGALPGHFFHRPEKSKKCPIFAYFPWWAHGPYSPGLGPLLLSTQGGAIGMDTQQGSSMSWTRSKCQQSGSHKNSQQLGGLLGWGSYHLDDIGLVGLPLHRVDPWVQWKRC